VTAFFNLLDQYNTEQWGGLSGPPLKPLALETLSHFYRLTHGSVPLIGCGGISSAEDAIEFARAGASLVQLYTSMSFRGPVVVSEIKRGILQELDKIGEDCTWSDLVGSGQPPKLRSK
jgi:dihydroorotate dehydrogenase